MPNYCQNVVTFTHADPAMIRRVVQGYTGDGLMAEFHPIPDKLISTMAGSYSDPVQQAELAAQENANLEEFGFKNWYDWAVENWGTKWDVTSEHNGDPAVNDDGLSVQFSFDSAWSPPIAFYEEMERQGFTVEAFYYEPGCAFCGIYRDGEDAEFSIPATSSEAEAAIPEELNEMFAIVESMANWESEEAEWKASQGNDNVSNEKEAG